MLPFPRTLKSLLHCVCPFRSCPFRLSPTLTTDITTVTLGTQSTGLMPVLGKPAPDPKNHFLQSWREPQFTAQVGIMKLEALPLQNGVLGASFHHVDLKGKKAEITSHCLTGKNLNREQEL